MNNLYKWELLAERLKKVGSDVTLKELARVIRNETGCDFHIAVGVAKMLKSMVK